MYSTVLSLRTIFVNYTESPSQTIRKQNTTAQHVRTPIQALTDYGYQRATKCTDSD